MKIVSFSLYGKDDKYIQGAFINSATVGIMYPNWQAVFYCGETVPSQVKSRLSELGSIVIEKNGPEDNTASLWRFEAVNIPNATHVIFRDADSRILDREVAAVNEWLDSGRTLHVMRDHPNHGWDIPAGLWGTRVSAEVKKILELPKFSAAENVYGLDALFLSKGVYRLFRRDAMIHDEIFFRNFHANKFPTPRLDGAFVGEVFNADGTVNSIERRLLHDFENNLSIRMKVQVLDIYKRLRELVSRHVKSLTRKNSLF